MPTLPALRPYIIEIRPKPRAHLRRFVGRYHASQEIAEDLAQRVAYDEFGLAATVTLVRPMTADEIAEASIPSSSPLYPKSTGYGSARYGACEICHTPASEIFIAPTRAGNNYVFGHEQCLRDVVAR